jgi:hypothetical protein
MEGLIIRCPYVASTLTRWIALKKKIDAENRYVAVNVPDRQRFAAWLKFDAKALVRVLILQIWTMAAR